MTLNKPNDSRGIPLRAHDLGKLIAIRNERRHRRCMAQFQCHSSRNQGEMGRIICYISRDVNYWWKLSTLCARNDMAVQLLIDLGFGHQN